MRSWLRFALQDVQTRTYQPVLTAAHRTSSTAVPVASLPELSAARLNRYYEVDTSQLDATSPGLSERWAPLSADAETQDFLDSCKPSWIMSFLASILRLFLSVTDTNGLLSRGSMFVLSSQQAGELIGLPVREARSSGRTNLRLLDVGAGDGEVTKKLAYLFDEVHTTEVSPWMARNLRAKGYNTTVTAFIGPDVFPESVKFDVVATMNLLDRWWGRLLLRCYLRQRCCVTARSHHNCSFASVVAVVGLRMLHYVSLLLCNSHRRCRRCSDHPADMLRNAMRLLVPGTGRILVAVVLPFSEFVEEGTVKRRVFGPLPMNGARCQGLCVCVFGCELHV